MPAFGTELHPWARHANVVIWHDLMAESVAQVAEHLGRTEKSVGGLLLRARRKLRELLAEAQ